MADFIIRLRKIDTTTQLLHFVGLVKQKASTNESENHATTELQQPGEVSSQFSTLCATEFAHFTMMTLKKADAYGCYLLLQGI